MKPSLVCTLKKQHLAVK